MIYYANPCSDDDVIAAMRAHEIGFIDTPAQGNKRPPGVLWCADNGCYGKGYPGDAQLLRWLAHNAADVETCAFATAPDVVGDHVATWERSKPFLDPIRELGYPAAFVAQDGMTADRFRDWNALDVLFIGGTDAFKLGLEAVRLIRAADERGIPSHMGRVNSGKRYAHAYAAGCSSVDGTFLTRAPRKNLGRLRKFTALTHVQEIAI